MACGIKSKFLNEFLWKPGKLSLILRLLLSLLPPFRLSPAWPPDYPTPSPLSQICLENLTPLGSVPREFVRIVLFSKPTWLLLSCWWTFLFTTFAFLALASLIRYWITSSFQHLFLHVSIVFPLSLPSPDPTINHLNSFTNTLIL